MKIDQHDTSMGQKNLSTRQELNPWSLEQDGRSIHWTTRNHEKQGHLSEFNDMTVEVIASSDKWIKYEKWMDEHDTRVG